MPDMRCKQIPLRFMLGEKPLFTVRFQMLALKSSLDEIVEQKNELYISAQTLPVEVDGAIARSHPISDGKQPRLCYVEGCLRYARSIYDRYYIDLSGSFEDYCRKFSSKTRSSLSRKVRKFRDASDGVLDFREYHTPQQLEEFYPIARRLSACGYQERLLHLGLPSSSEFQAEMRRLAQADSVRAYLLFSRDKPAAYLYSPIRNGIVMYDHLGYDQAMAGLSPGTVLQYLALEKLFGEHRWRLFDFTEGEGAHKALFSTGNVRCADLYYFRPTLRNKSWVILHAGMESLSRGIVSALDKTGFKSRIKRFFRST
ncbi:MAG: GNAT family N-acetyltransferase [Synergistaceae bacterium]|nr:GNAT family N-acetyltransferase [Synergistaceae bacterium]